MHNQSFKKVFVTNANTIGADGIKPTALADGILGFVDAGTNLVEATPTVAANPRIYIQQGETKLPINGAGVVPYGNVIPNKTMEIVRGRVTHWSGKKAVAGRTEKWTIEDKGGKCGDTRHLYIHLSGALVEQYVGKAGYTLHLQAEGPCCDTCDSDSCETILSDYWLEQWKKQLSEMQIPGGIPVSKVLNVTLTPFTPEVPADEEEPAVPAVPGYLTLEAALTNISTGECYWDLYPFYAEPVFMKISTYDPDVHNYTCSDANIEITRTQTALVATGSGYIVRQAEEASKRRDYQYLYDDMGSRFAHGPKLQALLTSTYDVLTLGFYHEYKSGGAIDNSQVYRNDYMVDFYFETGEATAFLAQMNTWVTGSNPELSAVSL